MIGLINFQPHLPKKVGAKVGCVTAAQPLVVLLIEYTRVALGCTLPPVWPMPTGVYLIKFLIGNLSYSPCSEPRHTVLFPDVTYTMYARHPS